MNLVAESSPLLSAFAYTKLRKAIDDIEETHGIQLQSTFGISPPAAPPCVTLVVVGDKSAGKTTVINRLLNTDWLPLEPTRNVVNLHLLHDAKERQTMVDAQSRLDGLSVSHFIRQTKDTLLPGQPLSLFLHLQAGAVDLLIVDTPGLPAGTDASLTQLVRTELQKSNIQVLWVHSASQDLRHSPTARLLSEFPDLKPILAITKCDRAVDSEWSEAGAPHALHWLATYPREAVWLRNVFYQPGNVTNQEQAWFQSLSLTAAPHTGLAALVTLLVQRLEEQQARSQENGAQTHRNHLFYDVALEIKRLSANHNELQESLECTETFFDDVSWLAFLNFSTKHLVNEPYHLPAENKSVVTPPSFPLAKDMFAKMAVALDWHVSALVQQTSWWQFAQEAKVGQQRLMASLRTWESELDQGLVVAKAAAMKYLPVLGMIGVNEICKRALIKTVFEPLGFGSLHASLGKVFAALAFPDVEVRFKRKLELVERQLCCLRAVVQCSPVHV